MASFPTSFPITIDGISATISSPKLSACTSYDIKRRDLRCEEKCELVLREVCGYSKRNLVFPRLDIRAQAVGSILTVQSTEQESSLKYLFRTENGGQVKVSVGKRENSRYYAQIEVLPSFVDNGNPILEKLILSWGIYKSDSSSFIPLEFQTSTPKVQKGISETPLRRNPFGTYVVEMEFEAHITPFYLSFVLKYLGGDESESLEIKSHRHTNFCVPVGFASGNPAPLGLSVSSDGRINFALFSRSAESVSLCLFDEKESEIPALEIEMDPYVNRTGDVWHASFDSVGMKPYVSYGYRCKGAGFNGTRSRVLLDPYAKLLRKVSGSPNLGELRDIPAFDWSGDSRPGLSLEKLVLYRLNVMHFTKDKSSKLPAEISGSFSGVMEKIEHFKKLGINGILLEPVFPYDEKKGPYSPFDYFSLVQEYGRDGNSISAFNSMKEMVKKMHSHGIEVYLEVVFTHTIEDGILQEIDPSSYFYADDKDGGLNAKNALNCNYPIVQQMIVDSLRYWVMEFHIDGFSFINASCLLKGSYGESLSRPPLIENIAFDPILSKTKLIADFWDPYDLKIREARFPHWKRWGEINSKFSNDVRNFVRGEGLISSLATRLCGSGDIFSAGRGPSFSFNYIARNFGLPLVDLVSFSHSGLASELSWNCGEEGPTDKKLVLERRLKQIRNFLFILFISLGVPIINMGDECGQSSGGSPSYSDRKPFNWNALNSSFSLQISQFISFMTSLRERRSDLLQKAEFLEEENIGWYHSDLSPPKWDDASTKFLAMELKAEKKGAESSSSMESSIVRGDLYVAFNASGSSENIILPTLPEEMGWARLVDTGLPYPGFFLSDGILVSKQMPGLITYDVKSYSCVLFEAKVQYG